MNRPHQLPTLFFRVSNSYPPNSVSELTIVVVVVIIIFIIIIIIIIIIITVMDCFS